MGLVSAYFQSRVMSAEQDYQYIRQWVDFTGKQVLDIGCGTGGKSLFWSRLGAQLVVGIDLLSLNTDDLSSVFQNMAQMRLPKFVQGDGAHLPFSSEVFDVITMHDVLEHLTEPTQVLEECRRVLRPSGLISIVSPHWYGLSGNHLWNYLGGRFWRYLHPHLILPRPLLWRLIEYVGRRRGYPNVQIHEEWDQFQRLNRLRISEIRTLVCSRFRIRYYYLRRAEVPLFRSLARLPAVSEVFSYGVVIVAAKE